MNLIHDLTERGIGVRNLADPIRVDSSRPEDPMAQLALVLLALFGQMERTYTAERVAHARSVGTARGRRVGRPITVAPAKLAWAVELRDTGHTIADIVAQTGIPRNQPVPAPPIPTHPAAHRRTRARLRPGPRQHADRLGGHPVTADRPAPATPADQLVARPW